MYARGQYTNQDEVKSFKIFVKAAKKGNVNAMVNVGIFYERGTGVEMSELEALKWYKIYADKDPEIGRLLTRVIKIVLDQTCVGNV